MAEAYLVIEGTSANRIAIEPTQIRAEGGPTFPTLIVPLTFSATPVTLHDKSTMTFSIISIHSNFILKDANQNVGLSMSPPIARKVNQPNTVFTAHLLFPLDHYRIEKIEDVRNGDLKCHCDINVLLGLHRDQDVLSDYERSYVQIDFDIPQSHWTSKILPQLGYGTIRIIEIPMTDRVIGEELKKSATELALAQQYFQKGDYDKSVGHCRSALETIQGKLDELKEVISSRSESDWVEEIATSTTIWLNKIYEKTYRLTNKPHHAPTMGHFSRYDADAIMLVTTALVSYVARLPIKESTLGGGKAKSGKQDT